MPFLILGFLAAWPVAPSKLDARAATVWIRAGDRAVGTGWVVDVERRWLVTARHVLADREKVEVFFQDQRDGQPILDRKHYLSERAELQKRVRLAIGKVIAKDETSDIAVLEVEALPNDARALPLSSRTPLSGAACFFVGHRHDSELLWGRTTGVVRQTGKLNEGYFWAGKRIGVGVPLLFLQMPVESGESGAAVLDEHGQVIGVVSAVAHRTPGLAYAVAASEIRKLLEKAQAQRLPVPAPPTAVKRTDVEAVLRGSVWIRPQATDGRSAGVLIDRERRLVLTTATAVGKDDLVDIVAPKWDGERIIAEASEYRDLLGLRLSGHCVQGVVLARDLTRDLAVIRIDEIPFRRDDSHEILREVPLASRPRIGERVSAVSHPIGEDLLWLYSQGSVRSVGKVTLRRDGGDESVKVTASLLQLPHQGSASGGPLVDVDGKLVGVLASRDGTRQELAYAAAPAEIREFLKSCRPLWAPESSADWHERAKYLAKRGRAAAGKYLVPREDIPKLKDLRIVAYSAKLLAETGDIKNARFAIADLVEHPRRSAEVNALLADACLACNDRDLAERSIESALKEDPKLATALVTRATMRKGKEALADVEAALAIDANIARAYVLRASLRDPGDAETNSKNLADLTRAVELEPYDVAIRFRRASAHIALKDYKKAANDFTRLTEIEPLKPDWWYELANAFFHAGDRPASQRCFGSVLRVDSRWHSKVFAAIRRNGKALLDDNAADVDRVAEWYVGAVRELLPLLNGQQKQLAGKWLKAALAEPDVRKRIEMMALVIEECAGSK
jgi:S1-C subfamily serine protease